MKSETYGLSQVLKRNDFGKQSYIFISNCITISNQQIEANEITHEKPIDILIHISGLSTKSPIEIV